MHLYYQSDIGRSILEALTVPLSGHFRPLPCSYLDTLALTVHLSGHFGLYRAVIWTLRPLPCRYLDTLALTVPLSGHFDRYRAVILTAAILLILSETPISHMFYYKEG